jgi:uncharacterized paraquat-inducible protein A
MSIRVVCPNGHILNVKDSLAGKLGLCPTCKARVQVPEIPRGELSEDAILNILGPAKLGPSRNGLVHEVADPVEPPVGSEIDRGGPPLKSCEKCNQLILAATHICPYCHTYIGKLEDF